METLGKRLFVVLPSFWAITAQSVYIAALAIAFWFRDFDLGYSGRVVTIVITGLLAALTLNEARQIRQGQNDFGFYGDTFRPAYFWLLLAAACIGVGFLGLQLVYARIDSYVFFCLGAVLSLVGYFGALGCATAGGLILMSVSQARSDIAQRLPRDWPFAYFQLRSRGKSRDTCN